MIKLTLSVSLSGARVIKLMSTSFRGKKLLAAAASVFLTDQHLELYLTETATAPPAQLNED